LRRKVDRRSLDDTVLRCFTFIDAVSRSVEARAALRKRGYGVAEHNDGWAKIAHVCTPTFPAPSSRESEHAALAATQAIEARDEDVFRVVRAALRHRHPRQAGFLLRGIGPARGAFAVRNTRLLVERLDALARGAHDGDHAALRTLASRGLGPEEIAELRVLRRRRFRGSGGATRRSSTCAPGTSSGPRSRAPRSGSGPSSSASASGERPACPRLRRPRVTSHALGSSSLLLAISPVRADRWSTLTSCA
jgi:hypothetical protein